MKILLDTHTLLWSFSNNDRLSNKAKNVFLDTQNQLFFSIASLWEIMIKISLKKLVLNDHWLEMIEKELQINSIQWLTIEKTHCLGIEHLPFHHRDPFDRLLISQAIAENMAIVTCDQYFTSYNVDVIW